MKETQIEHEAVVEQAMPHAVRLRIEQHSACSTCAAAGLCRSAESKEKTVLVPCARPQDYAPGQTVTIVGNTSLGLRAVLWAYVVPLVLLVSVLVAASAITGSEGLGALLALTSLAPYYGALYLLRHRLQRTFSFAIKS